MPLHIEQSGDMDRNAILKIQLQFVPIKVANHPLNAAVIKVFCAKLNDLVSHSSVSSNALKQTNEVVTFFSSRGFVVKQEI